MKEMLFSLRKLKVMAICLVLFAAWEMENSKMKIWLLPAV